jgi:predicted DNA-binding transcriptional regulator YafY
MGRTKGSTENQLAFVLGVLDVLHKHTGKNVSVQQIAKLLKEEHLNGAKRADASLVRRIQRALKTISDDDAQAWKAMGIKLSCTLNKTARLWRLDSQSQRLWQLGRPLGTDDALLMQLVKDQLLNVMPQSLLDSVAPYLDQAAATLAQPYQSNSRHYSSRLRAVPDGPLRVSPRIDPKIQATINEALLRECQVRLTYKKAQGTEAKVYELLPAAVGQKGLFTYLAAIKSDAVVNLRTVTPQNLQSFRLDRVQDAELLPDCIWPCELPEVDEVMHSGFFNHFPGPAVRLRIRFNDTQVGKDLAQSFDDAPFVDAGQVKTVREGRWELEATVLPSKDMLRLLQSYAHLMEIIEPPAIRQAMLRFANGVRASYG